MVGAALAFDGKSQWAEAPPEPGFDVAEEDFAIECWLRTADGARIRNIADKRDAQPKGYLLFLQRGRVGFQVAGAASLAVVLAESRPIADNRWHHVVAVSRRLPPSPPTIYVDGVLAAKGTRNVPLDDLDNKARVWLGRHHANEVVPRDDIYFEGAIDEFTVYRRALDPAEIRALYRAGAAGKCHAPRSVRPARK
ncbi:MAG: LamG domain-containing protein [Bryobacteraceae bacterium]